MWSKSQDEINLLRSGGNYGWDPVASDGSTYILMLRSFKNL